MRIVTKSGLIDIISTIYIFLFTYTAVDKLLNYTEFYHVLHSSPHIGRSAGFVAVSVPVIELFIVILLLIPKLRIKGLASALVLLVIFTTYITSLMLFETDLPCSCSGIFDQLTWKEHLSVNVLLVAIAIGGLVLSRSGGKSHNSNFMLN